MRCIYLTIDHISLCLPRAKSRSPGGGGGGGSQILSAADVLGWCSVLQNLDGTKTNNNKARWLDHSCTVRQMANVAHEFDLFLGVVKNVCFIYTHHAYTKYKFQWCKYTQRSLQRTNLHLKDCMVGETVVDWRFIICLALLERAVCGTKLSPPPHRQANPSNQGCS